MNPLMVSLSNHVPYIHIQNAVSSQIHLSKVQLLSKVDEKVIVDPCEGYFG